MHPILAPFAAAWRLLCRIKLTYWIVISVIVGVIVGATAPAFALNTKILATIFLRMIKLLIVPLIFSTLVVGIAGHGDDIMGLGRLALKSFVYFEVVTTLALAIGLLAVNIIRPGSGVQLKGAKPDQGAQLANKTTNINDILTNHIVPESMIKAAADNEVLQIVFCSILFAIAIMKLGPRKDLKKVMIDLNESLSEIMFKFTEIVMYFSPFGIGAAMAVTVGTSGLASLIPLGKLVLTLYGSLIIFIGIVLFPILLISRLPIRDFLSAIGPPVLIGFSTASSEAALPLAMENLRKLGCSKKVVAFVMPTGYSFNLDGTTLYLSLASVFCAQVGGIDLPIDQQIVIMLTLMLTSKGVAGVPRASLVVLSGALTTFGLPLEAVSLILGVDTFMDMARTGTNLIGNCLATCVVAKSEGEFRNDVWKHEHSLEAGIDVVGDLEDDISPVKSEM